MADEEEGTFGDDEQERYEVPPERLTPEDDLKKSDNEDDKDDQGAEDKTTDEGYAGEGEGDDQEVEVMDKGMELEEDINLTDSQVMIQLKEAEEEAAALRKEIAKLRTEVDDLNCRAVLTEGDEQHLEEIQTLLMEKIALLDELTKRIAKLMEIAGKRPSEDTTILEEEEEDGFPDDLLPKVVICSSWDDMMPKVVVCMDMKKPTTTSKKPQEEERDENGLTPEQREALEKERRCMAEERNRLQYQIACLEGEMRVMVRENDMLSRKVAQLKAEMDNQPPFEFEMSVSAMNQQQSCGPSRGGNMDMGVMGPNCDGAYTFGGAIAPGGEVTGKLALMPPSPQMMPGSSPHHPQNSSAKPHYPGGCGGPQSQQGNLPCGGITGIPGKTVPCPKLQPEQPQTNLNQDWTTMLPPYGKICRKDFNAAHPTDRNGCGGGGGGGCGGGNCGNCPSCAGGGCSNCCGGEGGPPSSYFGGTGCGGGNCGNCASCAGEGCNNCCGGGGLPNMSLLPNLLPPGLVKHPPMDVNFKVNVQPNNQACNKMGQTGADERSFKIAQQLEEIECELRRMQRDLCKAKKDKDTLKAQQDTLNCAKNYIM